MTGSFMAASASDEIKYRAYAREDYIRNENGLRQRQEYLEKSLAEANAALADKDAVIAEKEAALAKALSEIEELKAQKD